MKESLPAIFQQKVGRESQTMLFSVNSFPHDECVFLMKVEEMVTIIFLTCGFLEQSGMSWKIAKRVKMPHYEK